MKSGTWTAASQHQQQQPNGSSLTNHSRSGLNASLLSASQQSGATNGSSSNNKPVKFVISRPIRSIMLNPLQVKVLVPKSGRSVEYQLSKATPDPTGARPLPGAEDPSVTQALKSGQEAVYLSIQAQKAIDEPCTFSMSPHTHFDLVLRLDTDFLRTAHLLCKVVYQNVRGELKEMGPYLLHAMDQVSSYRLEEMNCKVSAKTGHHHIYLLVQLVSVDPAPVVKVSKQPTEQLPRLLPTCAVMPDFTVQWSPLATLRLIGDSGADSRPVYCVPDIMALCSGALRDLLQSAPSACGELVLQGAAHADLLMLARLTHPGTTFEVAPGNVRQVLRLAAKFRVPHLMATAERLLCQLLRLQLAGACLPAGLGRDELINLAAEFELQDLASVLQG